jgi:hypothetical protein
MLWQMTDDEIPPLRPPDQMPPIRSQADVWRHWRALMGPLGFSERLLWIQLVQPDGRMVPALQQIAELPRLPDRRLLDNLMSILKRLHVEMGGGSVAMLLSRPGPAGVTEQERTWARRLLDAAAAANVPMWPVHVANDHDLVAVTPDDLAATRRVAG